MLDGARECLTHCSRLFNSFSYREGESLLALVSYRGGVRREAVLANCENHGKWLEWRVEN